MHSSRSSSDTVRVGEARSLSFRFGDLELLRDRENRDINAISTENRHPNKKPMNKTGENYLVSLVKFTCGFVLVNSITCFFLMQANIGNNIKIADVQNCIRMCVCVFFKFTCDF